MKDQKEAGEQRRMFGALLLLFAVSLAMFVNGFLLAVGIAVYIVALLRIENFMQYIYGEWIYIFVFVVLPVLLLISFIATVWRYRFAWLRYYTRSEFYFVLVLISTAGYAQALPLWHAALISVLSGIGFFLTSLFTWHLPNASGKKNNE